MDILTGRKHQIRAHAQWIGHELVGEKIYGPDENIYLRFVENGLSPEDEAVVLMRRQALHAYEMDFSRVFDGVVFRAAPPDDFADFLKAHGMPCPR